MLSCFWKHLVYLLLLIIIINNTKIFYASNKHKQLVTFNMAIYIFTLKAKQLL